ncbi:MAG: murein hydrolase activator EnvC family protein [Gemmatimonadota bacterium]
MIPAVRLPIACALTSVLVASATASPAAAQQNVQRQLRESQLRLQEIREERAELERQMERIRSQVTDVRAELENVERQAAASSDAVRELDFQVAAIGATIDSTTRRLLRTRDRLTERRVLLRQRLRDIYKQGPLHTVRVLLSARSFADLLNRYKYLRMIADYDRLLVGQVETLADELAAQESELQSNLQQLQRLQAEQLQELARLRSLQEQRRATLREYGEQERRTRGRIAQLEQDERRLTSLIEELEEARRESERRRAVAGRPEAERTLTTDDLGSLDWPVEGRLVYRFGPEPRDEGVTLRRIGIGIATEPGTPVRAVQAGSIAMASFVEGYGPTVVISHGGGYYTSYHYLGSIGVREGQVVADGEVIGTVGGEQTPEGPHIEFQVRAPVRGGYPTVVDPLDWLRERSNP